MTGIYVRYWIELSFDDDDLGGLSLMQGCSRAAIMRHPINKDSAYGDTWSQPRQFLRQIHLMNSLISVRPIIHATMPPIQTKVVTHSGQLLVFIGPKIAKARYPMPKDTGKGVIVTHKGGLLFSFISCSPNRV